MNADAPELPATDRDREELAGLIWATHATAMLTALREGQPSAAVLNVCRAWLADNGVSIDSLRRIGGIAPETQALLAALPNFNDEASSK